METKQPDRSGSIKIPEGNGITGSRRPVGFVMLFFLICFVVRTFEILVIRTDQSIIGEAFINKVFGILLIAVALHILSLKWSDIGFRKDGVLTGMAVGIVFSGVVYAIAYGVEYTLSDASSGNAVVRFYATSYGLSGNAVMDSGMLFVFICIVGNMINVVMEEGVFRGLFIKVLKSKFIFLRAAVLSSLLFGVWHIVEPIRNLIDGVQSVHGVLAQCALLIFAAFLFGVSLCMLLELTGSLWAGMAIHFINNSSANLIHIVTATGADQMQTVRIAIAQTIIFVILLALSYFSKLRMKSVA